MGEFVASGRIADLLLAVLLVEAALIHVHHRRTGRGVALADVGWFLLAGAALAVALRVALTGGPWPAIAAALAVAGVAHVADLARRWRR